MILDSKTGIEINLPEGYRLFTIAENDESKTNEVIIDGKCIGILISPTSGSAEIFHDNATV